MYQTIVEVIKGCDLMRHIIIKLLKIFVPSYFHWSPVFKGKFPMFVKSRHTDEGK